MLLDCSKTPGLIFFSPFFHFPLLASQEKKQFQLASVFFLFSFFSFPSPCRSGKKNSFNQPLCFLFFSFSSSCKSREKTVSINLSVLFFFFSLLFFFFLFISTFRRNIYVFQLFIYLSK
ncbi:hypothetical protein CROQUDRAFT_367099 [Cronartium quercuum f. sp. fusiforme G11]|uniref:Transmembrane protein n=1 Tax=Cronartium quercuum f. sp. fusiforme G11 TaxID=708437 RepID=A0A9P6T689_9BASI|nr:hypothetical protein CROQUDRAFT_367099 [Cronartium quercuum f. sp. fusiforme G11]